MRVKLIAAGVLFTLMLLACSGVTIAPSEVDARRHQWFVSHALAFLAGGAFGAAAVWGAEGDLALQLATHRCKWGHRCNAQFLQQILEVARQQLAATKSLPVAPPPREVRLPED